MNMFVNAPDDKLVSTLLGAYLENRVEYIEDLTEKYFDDKTFLPNYRQYHLDRQAAGKPFKGFGYSKSISYMTNPEQIREINPELT
jgi:hypothetical protein